MDKKTILIVALACFCVLEGFLFFTSRQKPASDLDYLKEYQLNNRVFSPVLPAFADFAGEQVPLKQYYVREGFDRELSVNAFWQSNTLILLKKTKRFFSVIEPILKRNQIPDDFKYLALIESGLSTVSSPSGAAGFWQFMPDTGKKYGLEISEEVDQRYDLEKSTEAACKLLRHSYGLFNNWTLCAAAYNAGESRIQNASSAQKTSNYYDLYLNTETSRYMFRILAFKLLYEHPTEFGYYLRNKDMYPVIPTHKIIIDTSVSNLVQFASSLGLNYKVLKEFNPWLRKDKLTISAGKNYSITVPDKGFEDFDKLLNQISQAEMIFNDTVTAGKLYR
ncbi:MAG: lytic transglycosylase domain-containing protein [Bacteroidetes bacterium]|nr:lytic transglycosylase domain-containing protein [Bacteroidota bacterium]